MLQVRLELTGLLAAIGQTRSRTGLPTEALRAGARCSCGKVYFFFLARPAIAPKNFRCLSVSGLP